MNTPAPHPPFLPAWARPLATLAEPSYRMVTTIRNGLYDHGVLRSHRTHVPVVSVGNLTTGGTGKTPMVTLLVHKLQRANHRPAIVLRGYKRTADGVSDEQCLYEQALPGVPVVTGADRVAAAGRVQQAHASCDVIVLDDAFQHRRIARDVDLVLIDATNPLGYDHVLPRGTMRESPHGLRRADAVIVTRADVLTDAERAALDETITRYHGRPPIAHAAHTWVEILNEHDEPVAANGNPVVAFCGIGNPEPFLREAAMRMDLLGSLPLPDHVDYDARRIQQLAAMPDADRAVAYLTTEKDWVKLRPLVKSHPLPRPIWRPRLAMTLLDGESALDALLNRALTGTRDPS